MKTGDKVDLPDSQLGQAFGTGEVIDAWRGHIKVRFIDPLGNEHIGIYSVPGKENNGQPNSR